jgi:hypothetical protein
MKRSRLARLPPWLLNLYWRSSGGSWAELVPEGGAHPFTLCTYPFSALLGPWANSFRLLGLAHSPCWDQEQNHAEVLFLVCWGFFLDNISSLQWWAWDSRPLFSCLWCLDLDLQGPRCRIHRFRGYPFPLDPVPPRISWSEGIALGTPLLASWGQGRLAHFCPREWFINKNCY